MTEKKKREKVVAEITLVHLTQYARDLGRNLTDQEALAFLNQDGRAYAMWKHMMHAGEEYIKSTLDQSRRNPIPIPRPPSPRGRIAL